MAIIAAPKLIIWEEAMQQEFVTEIGKRATRIDWANDRELFYWAMKWRVRSEDIQEAALSVGANVRKIEAFLRNKGWLR
jgi:hypothetical protein